MSEQSNEKTGRNDKGLPARRLAVETLISIERDGAYATIALSSAFKRKQLSDRDRAFVTALVQGVVRHRIELDDKISRFSKQPFEKTPVTLRNVLRLGVFQLDHMEDIPISAVVDTSTQLAKVLGHQGQAKFANGLLRNYVRSKSDQSQRGAVAGNTYRAGLTTNSGGASSTAGETVGEKSGAPCSGTVAEGSGATSSGTIGETSNGAKSGNVCETSDASDPGRTGGMSSDTGTSGVMSSANADGSATAQPADATGVETAKAAGDVSGATRRGAKVNGVSNKNLVVESDTTSGAAKLSVKYSVPEWLVQRWLNNYGYEETVKLLAYAQSTPDLIVRSCEIAITPEGLATIFDNAGIRYRKGNLVESCLIIEPGQHVSPEKLPGYPEGMFSVQDEAAAFVSLVVAPKPGEFVVDLCAAPGGKSLHMAELMENTGRVLAIDKHANRLNLLKTNRSRLGLTNIEILASDGRTVTLDKPADRVLLDAPCTGTGVINRRSDLRYRRDAVDLTALSEIQQELLANAAKLLKPGGILVYSTCSIEPEENFDNIRRFMREHDFDGEDLSQFLPVSMREELQSCWGGPACKTEAEMTTPYMIQLLPSRHHVSGFFICRMRKR